jgi:Raf kinase inhibitor-like YbhB/YbcL family protein
MNLKLQSAAFGDGEAIPRKYTEDGENVSPPLAWSDPPEGVVQYALIMDDPDAPREEPWVHWVLHGIAGDVTELPEGLPRDEALKRPPGARQGLNSWGPGNLGYRGPAPPPGHGTHHYHFKLFALGEPLDLAGGIEKKALLKAMEGHTLATAELIGTYQR